MKITVLFFGISSDLVGENQLEVTLEKAISVADFKDYLQEKHFSLDKVKTYAIAVNESYATNDLVIKDNDVVAIIPPVSGG
jgi:molybdopterin converting factor subunit 1